MILNSCLGEYARILHSLILDGKIYPAEMSTTTLLGSHLLRRRTFPVHQSQSWCEIPACEIMNGVICLKKKRVQNSSFFIGNSRSSLDHVWKKLVYYLIPFVAWFEDHAHRTANSASPGYFHELPICTKSPCNMSSTWAKSWYPKRTGFSPSNVWKIDIARPEDMGKPTS